MGGKDTKRLKDLRLLRQAQSLKQKKIQTHQVERNPKDAEDCCVEKSEAQVKHSALNGEAFVDVSTVMCSPHF
jgi:hypothetical protein